MILPALSTGSGAVESSRATLSAMRPLPPSPVFDRADARTHGWSDAALSRAVRVGRIGRVRRGQFSACPDDPLVRALAAAAACGGSVLSHRSALLAHGLPVIGAAPMRPQLTVPPRTTGDLLDAELHRATLAPEDLVEVGGVLVTSVARTLIDVARRHTVTHSVAALDAALHARRVTCQELEPVLLRCWNWPRIRRAHRAVRLADARAESPLESVSRLVLLWAGLPTPDLQVTLLDEYRVARGRGDFYWDEFGVVGEADGRGKYDARSVLTREKYRQEVMEDLGLVFLRWGWDDAVYGRTALRARCLRAFARGAARDRSGLPRLWSIARAN